MPVEFNVIASLELFVLKYTGGQVRYELRVYVGDSPISTLPIPSVSMFEGLRSIGCEVTEIDAGNY